MEEVPGNIAIHLSTASLYFPCTQAIIHSGMVCVLNGEPHQDCRACITLVCVVFIPPLSGVPLYTVELASNNKNSERGQLL